MIAIIWLAAGGILPSPAAQRLEAPVQAAPPCAAAVVTAWSSWPTAAQVLTAAIRSTQSTAAGGCGATRRQLPVPPEDS
jgi:hypothetical protein